MSTPLPSVAVLHALFPGLDVVSALCIAACLTPTDPVTCAAITRLFPFPHLQPGIQLIFCLDGRFASMHVPVDIRRILSAESASNDGLAYPFLTIAIYLTVETSTRVAIGKWFLVGWLCELVHVKVYYCRPLIRLHDADEVILGTVLGAVLGQLLFITGE